MSSKDVVFVSSKDKDVVANRSFISELFVTALYKRNQGRIIRQVTCLVIWFTSAVAAWRFYETVLKEISVPGVSNLAASFIRIAVAAVLLVCGVWIGYRLVNWPRFADFLIAVEAEMNKVSWPTRPELVKASMVVIFTIFFLAILLFCYDLIWQAIFRLLKIS